MAYDALVLLSGGLDSCALLAWVIAQKRSPITVSFDYGQLWRPELRAAAQIAEHYQVPHQVIALPHLQTNHLVAKGRTTQEIAAGDIPSTYVPARNTVLLSLAVSIAEGLDIRDLYYGANQQDRAGYPDCRPAYLAAFNEMLRLGQKTPCTIHTPFSDLNKRQIGDLGRQLGAPLEMSFSCYAPEIDLPCGSCDACVLRREAFILR